jgi:mono/diheme cytochrome c family protein
VTVRRSASLLAAAAGAVAFATLVAPSFLNGKADDRLQAADAQPDLVARGKYLAEAADCAACHSAPGGAPLAGGLPMQSGFGTIYATNITPDADDGIGRWSAEDFWRALHDGVRRDGRQLYPAMPYTSYRGMTRADADAIYAYVMQLRPMNVANRRTELNFPFNIRLGMLGWNLLFLHDSLPAVSAGDSPAWQRGRYLVNVLGHCGECPTPRGLLGQMELAVVRRCSPQPHRRARHHAGGARVARLDGRRTPRISGTRLGSSRLGVRRHASGDHAQHQKSHGR